MTKSSQQHIAGISSKQIQEFKFETLVDRHYFRYYNNCGIFIVHSRLMRFVAQQIVQLYLFLIQHICKPRRIILPTVLPEGSHSNALENKPAKLSRFKRQHFLVVGEHYTSSHISRSRRNNNNETSLLLHYNNALHKAIITMTDAINRAKLPLHADFSSRRCDVNVYFVCDWKSQK